MNTIDEQLKSLHALATEQVLEEPYAATEALQRILKIGPMHNYAELIEIILNRPLSDQWYNGRQLINMGVLTLTHGVDRITGNEELSFIDHSAVVAAARIKIAADVLPKAFIQMTLLSELDAVNPAPPVPASKIDEYILSTAPVRAEGEALCGFTILARNLMVGLLNLSNHSYLTIIENVSIPNISVYFNVKDPTGRTTADRTVLKVTYYPDVIDEHADIVRKILEFNESKESSISEDDFDESGASDIDNDDED